MVFLLFTVLIYVHILCFSKDERFLICCIGVFLFIIAAELSAVMNYFAVCCSAPTFALPFSSKLSMFLLVFTIRH